LTAVLGWGEDHATAVSKTTAGGTSITHMPSTRVLIVDDQPVFRGVARDLLEVRGYTVVAEADGMANALEALGRCVPDAVLLDVCLGKESGFDVARALTGMRPGLAVLLVSADEVSDSSEQARRCGARGFVTKARLVKTDFGTYWGQAEGAQSA
jgi:CheY-like chemotaxis protein